MAHSNSTVATETTKAASISQPPTPQVQLSPEPEVDSASAFGQRLVNHVGGGSPQTPPSRYGSVLSQTEGAPTKRASALRQLQRTYGNQYVGRIIQAKLTVGAPGDRYEQEADRVAAQVVEQIHSPQVQATSIIQRQESPEADKLAMKPLSDSIQRQEISEDEEADKLAMKPLSDSIQRLEISEDEEEDKLAMKPLSQQSATGDRIPADNLASSIEGSRGKGQTLANPVRQSMEQAFGADFSAVQVHTNGESDRLNQSLKARAFTIGRDIYFKGGAYQPGSISGQKLLAHELTHVVQQNGVKHRGQIHTAPSQKASINRTPQTQALAPAAASISASNRDGVVQRASSFGLKDAYGATFRTAVKGIHDQLWADAVEYINHFSVGIAFMLPLEMGQVELSTGSSFAQWSGGRSLQFIEAVMVPLIVKEGLKFHSIAKLLTLSEDALASAINKARGANESGEGPFVYETAVTSMLRRLYTQQLAKSLKRIMPRYVAARNRAVIREANRTQASAYETEPNKEAIIPSAPIDRYVIPALCSGVVRVDFLQYREAHPYDSLQDDGETLDGEEALRPINLSFMVDRGLWKWVRVNSPTGATPEEVAREIYGDEALAYAITPAAPLFGFEPSKLQGDYETKWLQQISAFNAPGSVASSESALEQKLSVWGGYISTTDPVQEMLAGPLADEAALNQATNIRGTGASKEEIVQRMRLTIATLDGLIKDAATFGLDKRLVAIRGQIDLRSKALNASQDPIEPLKWDSHSMAQLSIVNSAAAGVHFAVEQYRTMSAGNEDVKYGRHLLDGIRRPIYEISKAYVEVAALSHLVETAKQKLDAANERSRMFPIEMMENILAHLQGLIQQASTDKTKLTKGGVGNDEQYNISEMKQREQALRDSLLKAREAILNNSDQIQTILQEIQEELNDLQTEVTLVANMDTIDAHWRMLYDGLSFLGVPTGKNSKYLEAGNALNKWYGLWREIYGEYRRGDKFKAKRMLKDLQQDPEWKRLFKQIGTLIEDEESFEKWVAVGVMIGIGVISAGVGAYVGAAAGAAWGSTAGGIAAVGAESLTGAVLTTMLDNNPSLKGLLKNLGQDLVMFGAFRAAGAGYRAMLGAKAATKIGKAGEAITMFVTAGAASLAQARLEKGKALTDAERYDVLLQTAAVLMGTKVGERVAKPLFKQLSGSGQALGNRLKFGKDLETVNLERARLEQLAAAVKTTKDMQQARDLLARDRALLAQEKSLIDRANEAISDPDPAVAAKKTQDLGLSPEDIKILRHMQAETQKAQSWLQQQEMMLELEPAGPNGFLCEPGRINAIRIHHKKLGSQVSDTIIDPVNEARTIHITPADGSPPFRVTEKLPGTKTGSLTRPPEVSSPSKNRQQADAAQNYLDRLPDATAIMDANPTSYRESKTIYENTWRDDPTREVGLFRNTDTGEYVIIQGDGSSVYVEGATGARESPRGSGEVQRWKEILNSKDVGEWELIHHSHPADPVTKTVAHSDRFPSGADGDMGVLLWESDWRDGQARASRIDYITPEGPNYTDFGYDPSAQNPFWMEVPDPSSGHRKRFEFEDIESYHDWMKQSFGVDSGPVPTSMHRQPTIPRSNRKPPNITDSVQTSLTDIGELSSNVDRLPAEYFDPVSRLNKGQIGNELQAIKSELMEVRGEVEGLSGEFPAHELDSAYRPQVEGLQTRLKTLKDAIPDPEPEFTELSQIGGLTATEGAYVLDDSGNIPLVKDNDTEVKDSGTENRVPASHPLTQHGPQKEINAMRKNVKKANKRNIDSKFTDRATMEKSVATVLKVKEAEIQAWLDSNPGFGQNKSFEHYLGPDSLGEGFYRDSNGEAVPMPQPLNWVRVVLKATGGNEVLLPDGRKIGGSRTTLPDGTIIERPYIIQTVILFKPELSF